MNNFTYQVDYQLPKTPKSTQLNGNETRHCQINFLNEVSIAKCTPNTNMILDALELSHHGFNGFSKGHLLFNLPNFPLLLLTINGISLEFRELNSIIFRAISRRFAADILS